MHTKVVLTRAFHMNLATFGAATCLKYIRYSFLTYRRGWRKGGGREGASERAREGGREGGRDDLRPDVVLWSPTQKSAILVELTVCYETNFEDAHRRKANKYKDLVEAGRGNSFDRSTVTLEVGSRGFLNAFFQASRVAAIKTDTSSYKTWQGRPYSGHTAFGHWETL